MQICAESGLGVSPNIGDIAADVKVSTKTIITLVIAGALTGCVGNQSCENSRIERGSQTVRPLDVPDDLTSPDVNRGLTIPNVDTPPSRNSDGCLDLAPSYFVGDGAVVGSAEAMIQAWAEAWQTGNAERVLSHYSAGFQPSGGDNLADWEQSLREQIANPEARNFTIDALTVSGQSPDRRLVRFIQLYDGPNGPARMRREMIVVREGRHWRVLSERSVE